MAATPQAEHAKQGDTPARAFPGVVALGLVAFMMATYAAGYAWSTPSADTADELLRAYEIRHAIAYPLEGPFLGNALHLGPMWWYLTALPLWVSQSWLAVALFIGAVCSLKFPLAYLCGRRLIDAEFGLLWAAAMFVPGWPTLEPLVFLNPNAVAAATLLVLFLALKCLEPKSEWPTFAALGLALAVAIHVHPTAAPVFLLLGPVLWIRYRERRSVLAPLAAITIFFLVPFVPYAVGEVRSSFGDWGTASAYMSAQVVPANIVNVPAIVVDYLFAGPVVIAEYLLRWPSAAASSLGVMMTLGGATSFAGAFDARARRWLLVFVGAVLVFATWIACTRTTTPFQFTWILCPVIGGLAAVGLWSLGRMNRLRPIIWTLAAASVAFNVFVIRAVASTVQDGEGHLPSRVMDIKNRIPPALFRDVWFPALAHGRLGRFLCDAGDVTLHGHLAYIVDKDLGLDALFECNDRSHLSLASRDAPSHIFGMTRKFWRVLGAEPECWVGSLGLTRRVSSLLDRVPISVADGSTYMPRRLARQPPEKTIFAFAAPARAALLVTNVLDGYEPSQMIVALAGGQTASAVAENDFSSLFAPRAGASGTVQWTLTVMATNAQAIEVVAIDLAPRATADAAGATACSDGRG